MAPVGFADATFDAVLPPSSPIIRFQPASQFAIVGTDVTLRVGVTGTEPFSYQWSFNGSNIPGATNPTLLLTSVDFADSGSYSVRISNPLGTTNTTPALLTVIRELTLGEAVDAPFLTWRTGGNASWVSQLLVTSDGMDAAESGHINHNQQTWIETTVTGPCPLSFRWKVSSEYLADFLEFLVDGALVNQLSGDSDWQHVTRALDAGPHTLTWRYSKDAVPGSAEGRDGAWVDAVVRGVVGGGILAHGASHSAGELSRERAGGARMLECIGDVRGGSRLRLLRRPRAARNQRSQP